MQNASLPCVSAVMFSYNLAYFVVVGLGLSGSKTVEREEPLLINSLGMVINYPVIWMLLDSLVAVGIAHPCVGLRTRLSSRQQ